MCTDDATIKIFGEEEAAAAAEDRNKYNNQPDKKKIVQIRVKKTWSENVVRFVADWTRRRRPKWTGPDWSVH